MLEVLTSHLLYQRLHRRREHHECLVVSLALDHFFLLASDKLFSFTLVDLLWNLVDDEGLRGPVSTQRLPKSITISISLSLFGCL